jgi:hypothetical protein
MSFRGRRLLPHGVDGLEFGRNLELHSNAMKVFSLLLDIYPDWHTEELKLI